MNKQIKIEDIIDKDFKDMTREEKNVYTNWRRQEAEQGKNERKIKSLYEIYKNTPKKLKIICDWDEVIQVCESYAYWLVPSGKGERPIEDFSEWFGYFWENRIGGTIEYSSYGSKLKVGWYIKGKLKPQIEIKNSPDFYQQAPFLTIAEDLLKLVKEGKVSRLIFLSAYDKRKFSHGDPRKEKIFKETFDKVGYPHEKKKDIVVLPCYLELIGFDSETQGQSKADWIKQNASDFDLAIDDNPNICESLVNCKECINLEPSENGVRFAPVECGKCFQGKVIAPYYPAIEHHPEVVLVKNEVSELKKEEFNHE
ncbi:MAG: hypothetical protein MRERV_3c098 [Mycoplasmataceae bacterium RV_VA103A]|nr:MAG: hypothetical protein MRERV_3c098 [Mycoplasmataceae bacterium RV_VA103A]